MFFQHAPLDLLKLDNSSYDVGGRIYSPHFRPPDERIPAKTSDREGPLGVMPFFENRR